MHFGDILDNMVDRRKKKKKNKKEFKRNRTQAIFACVKKIEKR